VNHHVDSGVLRKRPGDFTLVPDVDGAVNRPSARGLDALERSPHFPFLEELLIARLDDGERRRLASGLRLGDERRLQLLRRRKRARQLRLLTRRLWDASPEQERRTVALRQIHGDFGGDSASRPR
jgi:hypothetical protein